MLSLLYSTHMFNRLRKPWRGCPIALVPTCGRLSDPVPGMPRAVLTGSNSNVPPGTMNANVTKGAVVLTARSIHFFPQSYLHQSARLGTATDVPEPPSHHNPASRVAPPASRVWFVTALGTSSGFGRRLVDIALARGDRVIATARALANITHFRGGAGPNHASNIHCAELDISAGTTRVKERIDAIVQASGWGTVDVLVNNAGVGIPGFVEEGGAEVMRRQFETNVFGTLDVTTAILPYMRKKRSGTIAIVGSRSAWRPEIKGLGFYASSKAAIHAIAETLSVELEPFGIRILIVEPGAFRTEGIYRNSNFDESNLIPDYDAQRPSAVKTFVAGAGRQPGDPDKAMKALVEVVCEEGRAQGREWPVYLVLGKDAEQDVRNKCARVIRHLDEWSDMVRDVDLDAPDRS